MITKELVDRINFLARKSRYEGLSPEEKEEQQQVRQKYIHEIRTQVKDALESMSIQKKSSEDCNCSSSCGPSCGCGHHHH